MSDRIITVCDQAAGEVCPIWPGKPPLTAHWGVADPAAVTGDDAAKRAAFEHASGILARRIQLLTSLRLDALDQLAGDQLRRIGTPS